MTVNAASSGIRPIRIGLIGAGNWALRGHLPVLRLLPEYAIAAIQSRRCEAAESAATWLKIPHVLETGEQIARHPDVDLAVFLTIPPEHAAGVPAGKDVCVERPLSTSTALSKSRYTQRAIERWDDA
jgi:predicted dehydrogenase